MAAQREQTALIIQEQKNGRDQENQTTVVEDRNHLLAHFDKYEYTHLSLPELIKILTTRPESELAAKPLWIEIKNTENLGSLFIAVNKDRTVINTATPPESPTFDRIGLVAAPDQELLYFGVTTGFPLSKFIEALQQLPPDLPLVQVIYDARTIVSNKYRRRNNTSPVPSRSSLRLDGKYGAKSVLIEHSLIIPKTIPGDISEEIQLMLENDFEPLEKIKTQEAKIPGEIIGEDSVGILARTNVRKVRLFSPDSKEMLETYTYFERNNGVPLYRIVVKTNPDSDEKELTLLDVFRYDQVGEQYDTKVLNAKHLQISTALHEQLTVMPEEKAGVTLKNEARALHPIAGYESWSSRFGDFVTSDDLWANFMPGRHELADSLVAKIIDHMINLIPPELDKSTE
ncbi:hypothetical protein KA017_02040 [Candidatus Woesebacteria bacterium]|nr:hypothetical protein [Candidatus Woesebacteria bacterium]